MEDISQPTTNKNTSSMVNTPNDSANKKRNFSTRAIVIPLVVLAVIGIGFGVYKNLQYARQTELIGAQQLRPITYPVPSPGQNCNIDSFNINQPIGYSFAKSCMAVPNQMYSDDPRFTFFNLPPYLRNIAYIKTGNVLEKADPTLQWSISIVRTSDIYILYRKIPNQNPPKWIKDSYTKVTPDNFVELITYALRKNELGLIGVYDIYKLQTPLRPNQNLLPRPSGTIGTVNFGPASDNTVSAYSMYMVAVRSH